MKYERKFDRRAEGGHSVSRASVAMLLTGHEHDGEAVMPFGTDGLNRRCADALRPRQHLIEPAYSLDIRIVTLGVNHAAVADDIVDDDQAARP